MDTATPNSTPNFDPMAHRFTIQLYRLDTSVDPAVQECYAIVCDDAQQSQYVYDILQRIIQLISHRPIPS